MPPEIQPWLLAALLASVATGVLLLLRLERRLAAIEHALDKRGGVEQVLAALEKLAAAHAELDLRRVEHVLIDIRDGQKRVEDRLLASLEAHTARSTTSSALELSSQSLATTLPERIVTRLLALGYERIQFVTEVSEVQRLSAADGEVTIEARRDGAPCKGRVVVRSGAIADIQLQSAYSIFP